MPVSHFTAYYYFKKSKNDNSRQLVIYLYQAAWPTEHTEDRTQKAKTQKHTEQYQTTQSI